jgi:prolyl oligopeptidase
VDTYHGVKVADPYRWLEDWSDEQVRRWSAAQNAHARDYLDQVPQAKDIRARVRQILAAKTVSYSAAAYRRGKIFAIKRQPPKQQPFLRGGQPSRGR